MTLCAWASAVGGGKTGICIPWKLERRSKNL